MPNELYWDHTPAGHVSLYYQRGELLVFFEGNSFENQQLYFGHFVLKQMLETQTILGTIEYKTSNHQTEHFHYRLVGEFKNDSWRNFQGVWYQNEKAYAFNAIFEPSSYLEHRQQKATRHPWDSRLTQHTNCYDHLSSARQKYMSACLTDAVLSHHSIQRSMAFSDNSSRHLLHDLEAIDYPVTQVKKESGTTMQFGLYYTQEEI